MTGEVGVSVYVLIGVFVVLSAFFSGSEAALLSVQRVRIRHLAETGAAGASRVARMIERPERLLPPILLGNNLVNTAVAALTTSVALTLIEDEGRAVLAATVSVTLVLLVFGETIPKTLATSRAERIAMLVSLPMAGISLVLLPASIVLERLAASVGRLVGVTRSSQLITEEEIKTAVSLGGEVGAVERGEAETIRRLLELGERQAREVMTPRPEIVWVAQGASIADFLAVYAEHSHTRFPVSDADRGDVIGVVSAKDVLRQVAAGAALDAPAAGRLLPPFFVPETKKAGELLTEMQAGGHQMALIADEFGDLAGLVTLKRLVEGVVGSTTGGDEDVEEDVVPLGRDTFDVDAGISIADANERLGLGLPAGDYETVAGLVLARLGRVPEEGDRVAVEGLSIQVAEMRGVRVLRVLVTRSPASGPQG